MFGLDESVVHEQEEKEEEHREEEHEEKRREEEREEKRREEEREEKCRQLEEEKEEMQWRLEEEREEKRRKLEEERRLVSFCPKNKYPHLQPLKLDKGASWDRHSSHIVLTGINRLCGVDGSWLRQKLGILFY